MTDFGDISRTARAVKWYWAHSRFSSRRDHRYCQKVEEDYCFSSRWNSCPSREISRCSNPHLPKYKSDSRIDTQFSNLTARLQSSLFESSMFTDISSVAERERCTFMCETNDRSEKTLTTFYRVRNLIRTGNLIKAALFPRKVGGSTKNRTLFKLLRSFQWYEIAAL
jgi:hypothetical protein